MRFAGEGIYHNPNSLLCFPLNVKPFKTIPPFLKKKGEGINPSPLSCNSDSTYGRAASHHVHDLFHDLLCDSFIIGIVVQAIDVNDDISKCECLSAVRSIKSNRRHRVGKDFNAV